MEPERPKQNRMSCSVLVPNATRNYLGSKSVTNIILLFVARLLLDYVTSFINNTFLRAQWSSMKIQDCRISMT